VHRYCLVLSFSLFSFGLLACEGGPSISIECRESGHRKDSIDAMTAGPCPSLVPSDRTGECTFSEQPIIGAHHISNLPAMRPSELPYRQEGLPCCFLCEVCAQLCGPCCACCCDEYIEPCKFYGKCSCNCMGHCCTETGACCAELRDIAISPLPRGIRRHCSNEQHSEQELCVHRLACCLCCCWACVIPPAIASVLALTP